MTIAKSITVTRVPSEMWPKIRMHESIPREVLELAAREDRRGLQIDVIRHPEVTPEILDFLADSTHVYVQELVAQNGAASFDTLRKLANHKDETVRANIARWLPQEDRDKYPREVTLATEDMQSLFAALATDKSEYVRAAVAQNPSIPEGLARQLFHDQVPYIRMIAAYQAERFIMFAEMIARLPDKTIRERALGNPELSEASLDHIVRFGRPGDPIIRRAQERLAIMTERPDQTRARNRAIAEKRLR